MSHADPDAGRGTVPALGAYFIIPALACALTVYFFVSTRDLIWEARSTGTFIGVILLVLCITQFVRLGLKVSRGEATLGLGELAENTYYNRLRLALLILTIAFIALLPVIGTTLGLFLVLIAMIRLMGVRSWRVLVTVAFITAAAVHGLLIYLLGSQLPQGFLKPFFTSLGI
jgi:hypothetical protein